MLEGRGLHFKLGGKEGFIEVTRVKFEDPSVVRKQQIQTPPGKSVL